MEKKRIKPEHLFRFKKEYPVYAGEVSSEMDIISEEMISSQEWDDESRAHCPGGDENNFIGDLISPMGSLFWVDEDGRIHPHYFSLGKDFIQGHDLANEYCAKCTVWNGGCNIPQWQCDRVAVAADWAKVPGTAGEYCPQCRGQEMCLCGEDE